MIMWRNGSYSLAQNGTIWVWPI